MYLPAFCKAAREYEKFALPQAKVSCFLAENVLLNLDLEPVHSLWDIGCGTALASKAILRLLAERGHSYPCQRVLVDREPEMLDVAARNLLEFDELSANVILANAFEFEWVVTCQRNNQLLGRKIVISTYLLQWSDNPLDIILGPWLELLSTGDTLAVAFPDNRSFKLFQLSLEKVNLEERFFSMHHSDVLLGPKAQDQLSQYYELISFGKSDDSVSVNQPLDYLKHFSKIGANSLVPRFTNKEIKRIIGGLYETLEDGHPCRLDYFSTWMILKRL